MSVACLKPRTCGACRFFDRFDIEEDNGDGECRKQPPRIDPSPAARGWRAWPAVWSDEDWCGEYVEAIGRMARHG